MKKVLAIVLFSLLLGAKAHALPAGNTLTLEPALSDIEIAQSDTVKRATFTITNTYNVPVELSVELKGIDQQSGLMLPAGDLEPALQAAARLSDTLITIPEKSSQIITLLISNTDELSPGGHYATLVITQLKVGDSEVSLKQSISAGIFIVKRGGQLREVEPLNVSYDRSLFGLPHSAAVTIKNIGNVHVIPRASVTVYDNNETLVAKGVYNRDSRRILPSKELTEKVQVDSIARVWLPQRVRVVFEYRADSIEEFRYSETYMLYVPLPFSILMVVVFVLLTLIAGRALRRRKRKPNGVAIEQFAADVEGPKIPTKKSSSRSKKKIVVREE